MENKWHTCDRCNKTLSSYRSLWRHKQNCSRGAAAPYIPTFNGSEFGTGKQKSKETMEKIERLVQGRSSPSSSPSRNQAAGQKKSPAAAAGQNKPAPAPVQKEPQKDPKFSAILKPISFGELWCGEDWKKKKNNDDDDDEEEEEEEEEASFLPTTTIDRLKKRFNKLFCEFMKQDKLENRNELVYLLDEMLSHGYISGTDFRALNNILTQSLPSDSKEEEEVPPKEDEGEEEIVQDLKTLLKSTITYVIEHEKDELDELVEEFKEYNENVALELESLIEKVLNDHDNFEIVDDYDEIRAILGNSSIPKLKALRFKMLLNKIQRERYRVHAILSRLDEIDDEEHFALVVRSLTKEGLISEEQFEKLMKKNAALELESIADIIKEGSGLYLSQYPVEEGGGGLPTPEEYSSRIWGRRARLFDLLKEYDKDNHMGMTDLLKEIQWVKDTVNYWKYR